MFAFADETGNTGENLFDETQPDFVTAALITRGDFDLLYDRKIRSIAATVGERSLHANRFGVDKLEGIADDIRAVLRKADARFAVSRIEKKYLLVTKTVDYVFDCGENLAVPWQSYSLRSLRLLLVFKAAALIDRGLADLFWSALMAKRQADGERLFVDACKIFRSRVPELPDARSREVFSQALDWAVENPEGLTIHSNDRVARYFHLPNVVGFVNLLDGIELWSGNLDRPVHRITHDRQSQFERNFKFVHDLVTNASDEQLHWPGEEPRVFRKVFGSELVISTSEASVGIQVADVLLWLLKRVKSGDPIGPRSARLFNFMVGRGRLFDFSFDAASRGMAEIDAKVPQWDEMDEDARARARRMIEAERQRREFRIAEHRKTKLLSAGGQ